MTSGVIGPASLGLETNIRTHSSSSPPVDTKSSHLLLVSFYYFVLIYSNRIMKLTKSYFKFTPGPP